MDKKIVWTKNSELELHRILEFYFKRNKSHTYSLKLYQLFRTKLKSVATNPEIGIKTKLSTTRGLIVSDYTLFYEIHPDKIIVLRIWDNRQNPSKLKLL